MMEFVRTAIKNRGRALYLLSVLTLAVLGLSLWAGWTLWQNLQPEGPAGPLRATRKLQVEGGSGLKAITSDSAGKLYVADSRNDRIVVLNSRGGQVRVIDNQDLPEKEQIKNPVAVAISGDKLWVANYGNSKILLMNLKGKLLDVLPHGDEQEDLRIISANALAADQLGNLYAADGEKNRIVVFDPRGRIKLVFGSEGSAADKFFHINGLVVDDEQRRLLIQDAGNLRLVFTTLEGKFLNQVTWLEKGQDLFVVPRGLAYSPGTRRIYIADAMLDTVFALTEKGGVLYRGKEQLTYPQAMTLTPDGKLYVVNRENASIIKMNP